MSNYGKYVIQQSTGDVMQPLPWPLLIDEDGTVLTGLGPDDDGSVLIGFQHGDEQRVSLMFHEWTEDVQTAVGMCPVFSNGTNLFAMVVPIVAVSTK